MRKAICFLLALICLLSVPCAAFAASAAGDGASLSYPANPWNGDAIMGWVAVLVVSLVALIAAVFLYIKFIR